MAFSPDGPIVRHVSTVADMAEVVSRECHVNVSPKMLEAAEVCLPVQAAFYTEDCSTEIG